MISENTYLYCCDDISLIENYDKALNDNTQTYICHHRLEIDLKMSHKELIKINKYYNRPASELIFLTRQEHNSLHFSGENHYRYKKHCSEECKQKISQTLTGRKMSEEAKQKLKGRKMSEECKQKISQTLTGRKMSEEAKQKISKTLTGHKVSEETKQKISKTLTGNTLSEDTKQKISQKLKGRTVSEDTKEKLRNRVVSEETKEKLRNRIVSEETKEKLRLAAKKQWKKYHEIQNETYKRNNTTLLRNT